MMKIIMIAIFVFCHTSLAERKRMPSNKELERSSAKLRIEFNQYLSDFRREIKSPKSKRKKFEAADNLMLTLDKFYKDNIYGMNRKLRSDVIALRELYIPAGLPTLETSSPENCRGHKTRLLYVSNAEDESKLDQYAKIVNTWRKILCE